MLLYRVVGIVVNGVSPRSPSRPTEFMSEEFVRARRCFRALEIVDTLEYLSFGSPFFLCDEAEVTWFHSY